MGQRDDIRRWEGDVPGTSHVDEYRTWVLWGVGRPPDEEDDIDVAAVDDANEIVEVIADEHDPEWGDLDDGWVVLVEADEDEVDEFVQDNDSVYGYAPYLVEPESAGATPARMEGVLRGDRVKRRPFGASRPS